MQVQTLRKRPVEVQAVQLTEENMVEVEEWVKSQGGSAEVGGERLYIEAPEGVHEAEPPSFVVRGVKGEFYPVTEDVVHKSYDILG